MSIKAKMRAHGQPMAKLNPDSVREIRRRSDRGESTRSLSERFHVKPKAIEDVVARRTWATIR